MPTKKIIRRNRPATILKNLTKLGIPTAAAKL